MSCSFAIPFNVDTKSNSRHDEAQQKHEMKQNGGASGPEHFPSRIATSQQIKLERSRDAV